MLSSCCPSQSSPEFTEQQLKQLRAQCLVFLAVRDNRQLTKKHLDIALGESSAQGSSSGGGGGVHNRDETETGSSASLAVFSTPTAVLPPPDPLALSTLQLSSRRPRSGPTRRIRRGPRKIQ